MLPYNNLIIPDKQSRFPIYKQITRQLINLIQEGIIPPGTFFPGTRQMAELLVVNRKTIINAYEQLSNEDWIESVNRKGYRVVPGLETIKPRSFQPKSQFSNRINKSELFKSDNLNGFELNQAKSSDIIVNDGFPDPNLAPFKEISNIYRDENVRAKINQLMLLEDRGGLSSLRIAASIFLNETRGLNITKEDIVITRGAQMATYIALNVLLNKDNNVVVTEPNRLFANNIIENIGANVIKIDVDQDGPVIDQLATILLTTNIRVLYIAPHHHYPTTVTMSPHRRVHLLELIEKYGFVVVEDDYNYDFHYSNGPLLPLASSAHNGKIIYIGSFTKLLAPSVRIGYLIAEPGILKKVLELKRLIDIRGDTFMEYMLSEMITNGDLRRHIKKSNKVYAERCEIFCGLLEEKLAYAVEFIKPSGGLAVWLKFKDSFPITRILREATHLGLFITGLTFQKPGHSHNNSIRFGFASLSKPDLIRIVDVLVKLTS